MAKQRKAGGKRRQPAPREPVRRLLRTARTARRQRFTAVIERDTETGLFVGYVPGFVGAHSQAETLSELTANLHEVITMLLEDGEPRLDAEFVGTRQVSVG